MRRLFLVRATARLFFVIGTLIGALVFSTGAALAAAPQVVVSVPPLHSLAAAVMAGVGKPVLLLTGSTSPHASSMRPSQARALNQADLVVWVGPELEVALTRAHRASTHAERWLAVLPMDGIRRLPRRMASGEAAEEHGKAETHDGHDAAHADHDDHADHHEHGEHAHHDEHEHHDKHEHHEKHEHHDDHEQHTDSGHHDHDHAGTLDPHNAIVFVRGLAERLSKLSPAHADQFQANAARTVTDLEALKRQLVASADPLRGGGYAVYHDAYQYLERFLGLPAPVVVTVDPDQPRGARQVSRLAARLQQDQVRCLFTEPQFDGALVNALAERLGLQVGVLDPLGSTLTPGSAAYGQLLTGLIESMSQCRLAAK